MLMQLTKDDVIVYTDYRTGKQFMGFSLYKLQQVVEFYENHLIEDTPDEYDQEILRVEKKYPELYKKYQEHLNLSWNDWLFSYCFKDGLK